MKNKPYTLLLDSRAPAAIDNLSLRLSNTQSPADVQIKVNGKPVSLERVYLVTAKEENLSAIADKGWMER